MSLHLFPFSRQHFLAHYHGRYVHAKKLFIFDIALIMSVVFLIGAIVYFLVYDPTVRSSIAVTVTTPTNRFRSGDAVPLIVTYKNNSSVRLRDARLLIDLPDGFVADTGSIDGKRELIVDTLDPKASGGVTLQGILYATPETVTTVRGSLTYRQEARNDREEKIGVGLFVPHGSIVETHFTIASTTVSGSDEPFTLTIHNASDHTLPEIRVKIPRSTTITTSGLQATLGATGPAYWDFTNLPSGQDAILRGLIHFDNLTNSRQTTSVDIVPEIILANTVIPQTHTQTSVTIFPPPVTLSGTWGKTQVAHAGETIPLTIHIENVSATTIDHPVLSLPIPAGMIDVNRLVALNGGTVSQNVYTLPLPSSLDGTLNHVGNVDITLSIPISYTPIGGTDLSLNLTPRFSGTLHSDTAVPFTSRGIVPGLPIGTVVSLGSALRYYTVDGDQIGRGPLPPEVGKETRYWAMITIQNSTSQISDVTMSATVDPSIRWTGKTSVSLGQDVSYNPDTHSLYWHIPAMDPHDTAQISMEVGYTPTDATAVVPVISGITIHAFDEYIRSPIVVTAAPITSSPTTP